MTAQIPALKGHSSTTLRLLAELDIKEITGDVEVVLMRHSLDLWRKPVVKAFAPELASAIAGAADRAVQGNPEPVVAVTGRIANSFF